MFHSYNWFFLNVQTWQFYFLILNELINDLYDIGKFDMKPLQMKINCIIGLICLSPIILCLHYNIYLYYNSFLSIICQNFKNIRLMNDYILYKYNIFIIYLYLICNFLPNMYGKVVNYNHFYDHNIQRNITCLSYISNQRFCSNMNYCFIPSVLVKI